MPLSAVEVDQKKQAIPVDGVLPVFHQRWSPRSFADKAVSTGDLHKIFEAARWAASSYNEQPWRYLVGLKGDATYDKIFSLLIGFNQSWAKTAPVLILGIASTKFAQNGQDNVYGLYDLGAATAQLSLEAAELGIKTHSMAGFDHDAALKLFEVPENFVAGAVVALGYLGEPSALGAEQMIAMEEAPRERKPLNEIVYSSWGQAIQL